MRVVILGATGNVGTSVIEALASESQVTSIHAVARRVPRWQPPKTEWAAADIGTDDLTRHLLGADAVIHLAWLFQPTHDPVTTWRANALGSINVFETVENVGVPVLIYASSVGAYSPGPKEVLVDESWPTHGWPGAAYTREKAYVERCLDIFEHRNPGCRVVRLRPGFIFKRESAMEQRRLFAGPLLPHMLVRPGLIPVVPDLPGLRFQAVHSRDVGEAYRLALIRDVRGPFNIAADPPIGPSELAQVLDARTVRMPAKAIRALTAAAWHLRAVPASPDLFDAVLRLPLMDTTRAETELGWSPQQTALDALAEMLEGMRSGAGMPTPTLDPHAGGPLRVKEFTTGVGGKA